MKVQKLILGMYHVFLHVFSVMVETETYISRKYKCFVSEQLEMNEIEFKSYNIKENRKYIYNIRTLSHLFRFYSAQRILRLTSKSVLGIHFFLHSSLQTSLTFFFTLIRFSWIMLEMHTEVLVGFHVKCPYCHLILTNMGDVLIWNLMKIHSVVLLFLHAERHTWWD
jgi:hypothetical protein